MSHTSLLTTAILCITLLAAVGSAQGLYLTAGAGYGLGAGTQTLGTNLASSGPTTSYEGVYGSFGEGVKIGVSAGYMFSPNLGAELGFSYWPAKTFEFNSRSTGSTVTSQWSGSGFVAVPSIVLSSGLKTINPYARFGLILGLLKLKNEARLAQPAPAIQSVEYTVEETGNLAFGYACALGVVVPAGGAVDVFAEVAIHSVTYSPHQEEITRYTVEGVDQLASLSQKVLEFKESFTSGGSLTELAVRRPFSTVGFVAGVRINL